MPDYGISDFLRNEFVHEIVDIDTIPVPYAGINTFNHYPYTRDIVCVAPTLDSPAQTTCFVGDAVVQSMMCLMAKARLARKAK